MGPNARYADVMEQALYNGSISRPSLDGSLFFYENPLESRGEHHRWNWHRCPCCPPNVGRIVASIGCYYSVGEDTIAVHLYADSDADLVVGRTAVRIVQHTTYPWDGEVEIGVGLPQPGLFALLLRVPGWCATRPSP